MKRLLIAGALALAALSAAACSGCSVLSTDRAALSHTVLDEKALYGAEAAFFGANTAAEAAVDAGLVQPGSPDAVKIADALDKAHDVLIAARDAYRLGDAKSYAAKASAVQRLVSDAWALIPGKAA